MDNLNLKQQKIIEILIKNGNLASSAIRAELVKEKHTVSLVTVKRILSEMAKADLIIAAGTGRSTIYKIAVLGRIFADIDFDKYYQQEPDKRYGFNQYNFDLFLNFPANIFSDSELQELNLVTDEYHSRTKDLPPAINKRELERLIIELAWKSSKIEGNTYTLLETEKLILENKEAVGRAKNETRMILNHKDAFNFIIKNLAEFKILNRGNLEKLHSILVKDMDVGLGYRNIPVGITGSKYIPLGNIYQIQEAAKNLFERIEKIENIFAKALIAVLGISYIQPFEDGNKRTARLMANAILLAHGLAPLSYRSVDEDEYRKAMIIFYEINSIYLFKKIFVEQYKFAAKNYSVKI